MRYVFTGTIAISLMFSAFSSWVFLGDGYDEDLCARKSLGYQTQWYEMYSTFNDFICVWTPFFYIMAVYLFFLAFIPLQLGTLATWLAVRFLHRKKSEE